VTRAPSVTLERPMRPEMGAVTVVYWRLMRAVSTAAFQYRISASFCLRAASASSLFLLAHGLVRQENRRRWARRRTAERLASDGPGRPGHSPGCLVGRGIDLVQGLPCLHIGPLREEALLDDPSHLGSNLGDKAGRGSAGQFGRQGQPLGRHGHDSHLRWSALGRSSRIPTLSATS
jgi:hypothetical protein